MVPVKVCLDFNGIWERSRLAGCILWVKSRDGVKGCGVVCTEIRCVPTWVTLTWCLPG